MCTPRPRDNTTDPQTRQDTQIPSPTREAGERNARTNRRRHGQQGPTSNLTRAPTSTPRRGNPANFGVHFCIWTRSSMTARTHGSTRPLACNNAQRKRTSVAQIGRIREATTRQHGPSGRNFECDANVQVRHAGNLHCSEILGSFTNPPNMNCFDPCCNFQWQGGPQFPCM